MNLREIKNKLRKVKAVYLAINFGGLCAQVAARTAFRGIAFFIPIKKNRILFRAYEVEATLVALNILVST